MDPPPAAVSTLSDPARLRTLEEVGLMHAGANPELDRLSALAAKCLSAPVCMVSLVGGDRLALPGAVGLAEPWATERSASLAHSLCQQVVLGTSPLAVADVRAESFPGPSTANGFGITGYLGIPITTPEGLVLGAFCVIDAKPREWSPEEISLAEGFAAIVSDFLGDRIGKARADQAFHVVIHDLKTPLAGMAMATGLLQERQGDLPEQILPLVEILSESTNKALELVKSLLRKP